MCSQRRLVDRRQGFTLLEVIIATMIIGMMTVTLYHFISTSLRAINVSSTTSDDREALRAVVRVVELQLRSIAPQQREALQGRPLKFRGLSNDELIWRTTAGAGLMTSAAPGEYRVTLTVQPVGDRSAETELGLRRQFIDPTEAVEAAPITRGQGSGKYNWLPLIRPMAAIEVRYFDGARSSWQDTWNDPNRLPSLVSIRLWKDANLPPLEAFINVPSARMRE
jgi:prepilin-type N-terminal cleavage/methylation domain-containing protein